MVEAPDQSPQLVAPSRARTRMPHAVPIVSDLSALRPAVAATAVAQLPDPERWPRPYAPMPVRSSVPAGQPTRTVARVDDIWEPATKANVFGADLGGGGGPGAEVEVWGGVVGGGGGAAAPRPPVQVAAGGLNPARER